MWSVHCGQVASSKERTLKSATPLRQLVISLQHWRRNGSLTSNLSALRKNLLKDFSGCALKRRAAKVHMVKHSGRDVDKGYLIHYSKLTLIHFSSA